MPIPEPVTGPGDCDTAIGQFRSRAHSLTSPGRSLVLADLIPSLAGLGGSSPEGGQDAVL